MKTKLEMHIHPHVAHVRDGGELPALAITSPRGDAIALRIAATAFGKGEKMKVRRFNERAEEVKR